MIVGYVGLSGVVVAVLLGACTTMALQDRITRRRLISNAERFLADYDERRGLGTGQLTLF